MALCIAPITQPGIILVEFRADAKRAVCWVGIHIRAEDRLVQSVVIDLFNPDARGVCFYAEIIRFFLGQVDNAKFRFRNPNGLDADVHYTTAKELAMLTAYAYTFPEIRECWKTSSKTIQSLKYGKKWTVWSNDSILGYISNFLGGKTGTEDNAGCCFTGAYEYKGSVYITVVLGSGYGVSRWTDTKKLHKYITKYAATKY